MENKLTVEHLYKEENLFRCPVPKLEKQVRLKKYNKLRIISFHVSVTHSNYFLNFASKQVSQILKKTK
jgi:hypothetical protein